MLDLLRSLLMKRRQAYRIVFDPNSANAHIVLADLRKFCAATGSKYRGNYEKTLIQIGRNEVWERINSYCNIPDDQLAKIVENIE
jgi:hypothetical protein